MTIREWRKRKPGEKTREVVRVEKTELEKLPEEWNEWRVKVEAALKALSDRLSASQEYVTPLAMSEFAERLQNLERGEVDNAQLQQLGQDLAELSAAVLMHIRVLQKRVEACEARFDELPAVLAQIQAERRRA